MAAVLDANHVLPLSQWTPFKTVGNYLVLGPDSADQFNLQWYGYFAGSGVASGQKPLITVNYTH